MKLEDLLADKADKEHTHTLSEITDYEEPDLSPYAKKADVDSALADLKAALLDGVFIMFHRNRDDYPLMVKPDKWASYQGSGEIAEGVVGVEGGKILVVAPTETSLD